MVKIFHEFKIGEVVDEYRKETCYFPKYKMKMNKVNFYYIKWVIKNNKTELFCKNQIRFCLDI